MNGWRRLFAIVMKELMQLRRDRLTFAMIIGIPTMQLLMFGYAINNDVRHIRAAVVDQAMTAQSREVIGDITHSQVVDIVHRVDTAGEADALLRAGDVSVVIVVPRDFARRLARRDEPVMQLMVDGSDSVILQAARQIASVPLGAAAASAPRIEILNRYNPERRAAINTVPGLIGVILTMTMVLFTAVAIVRERERGNLEMLITTPVRSLELVVGKVVPFIAIGLVQVTVVLILGALIFDVPVRGALWALYVAALTYIVAALSLGVFVSTLAKTQFQAMQIAFFTFLPQILLSGFMFPYAGMPRAAQWFAEILPLTHFIRLVRGIQLRDATLAAMWHEVAALWLFVAIALTIAIVRFRKTLD